MIVDHLDACVQALNEHGIPCTEYQMWEDGGEVHYWFGTARPLTEEEQAVMDQILYAYIRGPS